MQYFDLHCDTLYKAVTDNSNLDNPLYEVILREGMKFDKWCQCTAIWIPDDATDEYALSLFRKAHKRLVTDAGINKINVLSDKCNFDNHNLIFTLENAKLLADDLSRIDMLYECNVKMVTLTWNAENCLGGGSQAQHKGLTDFGRECIKELENKGIIIDLSHSSDKTFYDVVSLTQKPVVASHSNARSVCPHMRNLTDEQFIEISKRGGLVGLNFHKEFLSKDKNSACVKDVLKHTEHFLSLGGEDSVCIGSDFDGSEIPNELNNISKIPVLYESFLKIGYNEQLVQKILYNNAYNFFSRF